MTKTKFISFIFALILPFWAFAKTSLEIQSIKPFQKWEPNKIQELVLTIKLPKDFHAYKDQLKVINVKPEGFKSGEIKIQPEIEFYDNFSKKNRIGLGENGTISILFEAGDKIPDSAEKIEFDLRHQICSPKVCFLPTNLHVIADAISAPTAAVQEPSSSLFSNFENSLQTNLPLAFLLVFLAGVLTSFTPCIFPMLPITLSVLGHHAESRTRMQNFVRALVYVLGIAMTYSSLGVVAALTGNLFGSALTNRYILVGLSILFFIMAFSMWGVFELQAPRFIRNRFSSGRSENNFEAFLLGLVAGIVASPCVGPVLVSILTFVSTTKNAVLGFSLLFVFACGIGLLFMVIGFFGEAMRYLPKSGRWMDFIKFILGACMWSAALYYLQFAIPNRWWIFAVALSFVALAIWKGAFNFRRKAYFRQSFLLMLFVSSFTVALLALVRPTYLNSTIHTQDTTEKTSSLPWIDYTPEQVEKAVAEGQPVFIDFYADWCAACHELEEKTYTNPEFVQISKAFKLIKVNATVDNEQTEKILKKYQVQGLPTVLFINKKGDLLKHLTFTQFITWDELKPKMLESLK